MGSQKSPGQSTRQKKLLKLEAIRGAAAVYVVFHHTVNSFNLFGYDLSFIFRFGQEAVILFFILSGFVIEYSFNKGRDKTFKTYFAKRFLRIYIPILLVYVANYAILLWQQREIEVTFSQIVLNLLMLQDLAWIKPNVVVAPLFGNSPLWSLSYEWWFYMLYFPIMKWLPKKSSALVYGLGIAAALSYLIYPNFLNRELMYFVIWWSGVVLARLYVSKEGISIARLGTVFSVIAGICAILGLNAYLNYEGKGVGLSPVLEARHFVFTIVALLIALGWRRMHWFMFDRLLGVFAKLAPISFGLYISHYFLVSHATYLNDVLPESAVIRFLVYLIICLCFSYLVERVIYTKINNAYRNSSFATKSTPVSSPSY